MEAPYGGGRLPPPNRLAQLNARSASGSNRLGVRNHWHKSLQKRLAKDEGIPPNDLRARVLGSEQGLLDKSMRRAAARHEIDPSPLTQRRKSVVIDVLRHELLMAQSPNADAVIYRGRRDQDNQRPVVPASITSDPAAKTSA